MSAWENAVLPGRPGPKLIAAWTGMSARTREAFLPHLLCDTAAETIAAWLRQAGHPVSASTIRTYRRALLLTDHIHKETEVST